MRIIHLLSGKEWGPAENMAFELCRHFKSAGHTVEVMCRNTTAVTTPFNDAGITVNTAPLKGNLDVVSPVRLSKLLRNSPAGNTIIHTHRFSDAVTASRARTLAGTPEARIVLTRHITTPAVTGIAAGAIYADIDALIFSSAWSHDRFLSTSPEISGEKLHIIRPATAPHHNTAAPVPVRDRDTHTLITAGDIDADKGLDTLIDALAQLKRHNFRLIVIGQGTGPVVMPAIRAARRYGIADRIEWRGNDKSLWQAIDEADTAVCPEKAISLQGHELPAYLATGIHIVASDITLHRELLADNPAAALFTSGNAQSLAEALDAALSAPAQSKHAADRFPQFAAEVETLYNTLIK